jgi:LysM repeat protein
MTDDYRPPDEPWAPAEGTPGGDAPATQRRRRWGVLPWIIGAIAVLLLAAGAGLGVAYLVAEMQAAPPPRTALPSPTPTASPTRTTAPPATPTANAPTATPTEEPTEEPEETPLPEATPREHIVARGESVSRIAAEYGVTVEEIVELNELRNADVIVPGQRLLIPPPP